MNLKLLIYKVKNCIVYICLFIIFTTNTIKAQTEIVTDFSIPWKKNITTDTIEYLYFQNARYLTEEEGKNNFELNKLPFIEKTFELKRFTKVAFAITDTIVMQIDSVANTDKPSYRRLVNKKYIAENFKYQTTWYHSGKVSKLKVRIFPVRQKNTGDFECITYCRFKIIVTPDNYSNIIDNYKKQSVLKDGKWAKVKIKKDGIYKLTFSDLKALGISNATSVKVFGTGGERLPLNPNQQCADDLVETAVYYGLDYILFYGKDPNSWNYNYGQGIFQHSLNKYSTWSYYYLTSDLGNTTAISNVSYSNNNGAIDLYEYTNCQFHEIDNISIERSGLEWVGEGFETNKEYNINFLGTNASSNQKAILYYSLWGEGVGGTGFTITTPDGFVKQLTLNNIHNKPIQEFDGMLYFSPSFNNYNINVKYLTGNNSKGYINYLGINQTRNLEFEGNWLLFKNSKTLAGSATYHVKNANNNVIIWDITDLASIKNVPYKLNNAEALFGTEANKISQYVIFNPTAGFDKPEIKGTDVGEVKNQNLHGLQKANMVIVVPDNEGFIIQAKRLANKRQTERGWKVEVVTTTQIYNEFSMGSPDVSAIRNFARMLWLRDKEFKYLLLMGDGSFDNKNFVKGNSNLIPTYQSAESLHKTASFVSDDFFGWLDDSGIEAVNNLDIAVGRLPVKDSIEARQMIDKIFVYESAASFGDWRNLICFAADDDDENQPWHMDDTDNMANFVSMNYPQYLTSKIYIGAYQQTTSSTGQTCPGAKQKVDLNMNKGMLIFNYTGHGGVNQLAHEDIVDKYNLQNWRNNKYFPLIFTASCEVSRFDNVNVINREKLYGDHTSLGEAMLLKPDGGAIALFSTTREVYTTGNNALNIEFYYNVLQKDESGKYFCLGEIFKDSKNYNDAPAKTGYLYINKFDSLTQGWYYGNSNRFNALNFTLLGDPSMRLNTPGWNGVKTDTINKKDVYLQPDTLKALQEVTVKGHIDDEFGNEMKQFNGTVIASIYDKAVNRNIISNYDNNTPFKSMENLIFKGKAIVKNGKFSYSFLVPKDINYSVGLGSAHYYAYNNELDLNGQSNRFFVGGLNNNAETDIDAPEIKLFMNDTNFIDGGITNTNPWLLAKISDNSGTSTSGWGIGHDIVAVLDNDPNKTFILNDFYVADYNNYKIGMARYPLSDLSIGMHTMSVKVWDTYNNSHATNIKFNVVGDNNLNLLHVRNYPNPVIDYTNFVFEHNFPEQNLVITIRIYNSMGNMVSVINTKSNSIGFTSQPLFWNATGANGQKLSSGIYLYQINVKTPANGTSFGSGKLLIK